jgi:hypothetical protein
MEIAKFGTMKVPAKCRHDNVDKGTSRQNTDLNLYYKTLLCDFKAIHRYIKHQIPAKARRWLARLSVAVDAPDNGALLQMGGPNAWTAWAIVLWWRAVRAHGFDSKASLVCRPYWLALDPAIPTWGDKSQAKPISCASPGFRSHMACSLDQRRRASEVLVFGSRCCGSPKPPSPCSHGHSDLYNEIRSRTGVLESAQTTC